MIDFADKQCPDLMARLDGLVWVEDGDWVYRDAVAAQAVIDAYTLADCQSAVCAAITAHATAIRDRLIAGISPGEMAAWSIKRAEAEAYLASGNLADAPLLAAEAAARGISVEALTARVVSNAAALSQLEAVVAGNDGRHRDAVRALTSVADVMQYDWSAGWPAS